MKQLTLDQFLANLSWSDNVRQKLRAMADRDDLMCLVAWDNAGKLSASAYTSKPDAWPDTAVAVWCKRPLPEVDLTKSKTMQALDLVLDQGLTVYAAAKKIGVNQSAVHRALQRREDREICPCCGQIVREGFSVDSSALKGPARRPASS